VVVAGKPLATSIRQIYENSQEKLVFFDNKKGHRAIHKRDRPQKRGNPRLIGGKKTEGKWKG